MYLLIEKNWRNSVSDQWRRERHFQLKSLPIIKKKHPDEWIKIFIKFNNTEILGVSNTHVHII